MEDDQWGRDPSVQAMRRVFAAIESAQAVLLDSTGLNPMDRRVGRWRRTALERFEARWALSLRLGKRLEENDVRDLYLYCLEETLRADGINTATHLSSPLIEGILGDERA